MSIVATYAGSVFGDPAAITITAPASGNDLVVCLAISDSNQPLVGVTDDQSNAYPQVATRVNQGANGDIYFLLAENITNGPTTISADLTTAGLVVYVVWEISGLANSPFIEAIAAATGESTAPQASFTASQANECVVGYVDLALGTTISSANGYAVRPTAPAPGTFDAGLDDFDVGASGSKTIDATLASSIAWAISGIRLSVNAAGGAARQNMYYQRKVFFPI